VVEAKEEKEVIRKKVDDVLEVEAKRCKITSVDVQQKMSNAVKRLQIAVGDDRCGTYCSIMLFKNPLVFHLLSDKVIQ